jgi:hypothetical protein
MFCDLAASLMGNNDVALIDFVGSDRIVGGGRSLSSLVKSMAVLFDLPASVVADTDNVSRYLHYMALNSLRGLLAMLIITVMPLCIMLCGNTSCSFCSYICK